MTIEEALELNIFTLPGLRDLPYGEKEKLARQFAGQILERTVESIANELPDDKAEEFITMFVENNLPEQRAQFLNEHVPNFEEIVIRETLLLKEDIKKFSETQKAI